MTRAGCCTMDSEDYEEYEERRCFRYVIDSSLENSVRHPGELDSLAGPRGILGYIITKKTTQKTSTAAAAFSRQDDSNYEQPNLLVKKQCFENAEENEDVDNDNSDKKDICCLCGSRHGCDTLIKCSYCLRYVHTECYNLKHEASLKGVPRGLFACHGEVCKLWYIQQVQQKKIKNHLKLIGLTVPEDDVNGGSSNESSKLCDETNFNDEGHHSESPSDSKVALPSDDNWDENANGNTPKKVIVLAATQPNQTTDDADTDGGQVGSPPSLDRSNGSTSSSRARHLPTQTQAALQPETETTASAACDDGSICKLLTAFEEHFVAITPTMKTPFDKTICTHALEIAKSSQPALIAKHVVNKTLASEFRPALRELFLLYGLTKISPDEYGKKGKSAICTVLLEIFTKMTPEQHKSQVRESLELPLRNALATFSMHSLMINVPRDEVLTVGNDWYFGSDADLRVDLRASISSAVTKESSHLLSFIDWLAREEGSSTCVMDWTTSINEQNFSQFPLLDVDLESGYVQKPNSLFYQMRRARTLDEWISQLYYIILTTFAHTSHNALAGSDATLVHRCKGTARLLREGSTTLSDIVKKTFLKSAAVEAVFFGTTLFWRLVGEKGKVGKTSQLRLATLFAQRVKRNYVLLQEKADLKRKVLSVKDMFNLQRTDSHRRPTVADIDADDFCDD